MKQFLIFVTILFICSGCEFFKYKESNYRELYVVESYLIANGPLPQVRVSTTSPIGEGYKISEKYLENADVEIRLLRADDSIARRYEYYGDGIYYPVDSTMTVQANHMYQLYITLQNGDVIKAKTQVPGDFETINELQDAYVYQGNRQVGITMTPSFYPGRQTFYVFTANAMKPDTSNLTPFYAELVLKKGDHILSYAINSLGIINEKSLIQNNDKTLTFRIPWLTFAFFGENNIIVNAIDDNLYDFLRTQNFQIGDLRFAPDEIHNVNYNITGGIGIFGSMSSDTNTVFISRP